MGTRSRLHAGSHYVLWAELHDLIDVYDDPAAFEVAALETAQSWLVGPDDEARHVEWLRERQEWLQQYCRDHPPLL